MWYMIPNALLLFTVMSGVTSWLRSGKFGYFSLFLAFITIVAFAAFPVQYYSNRNDCWKLESYYQNLIEPNIIYEYGDYVVISNIEGALWQSGDSNLTDYNKQLKIQMYWQNTTWGYLSMYHMPDNYKYVRIQKEIGE